MTRMFVNEQLFETEGVSHQVYVRRQMDLLEEKYSWNDAVGLKNAEPFFSATMHNVVDQGALKQNSKTILEGMYANFKSHDNTEDTVNKMREFGMPQLLKKLYNMDYNTLIGLFTELKADSSNKGVTLRNIFTEAIGSVGTRAAAMMVKDAIEGGMFDNDRDAARALTSVAFHIRRPNKALYKQYKTISIPGDFTFTQMAFPLSRAHLARRTCELAGPHLSVEFQECITQIIDPLADEAFQRGLSGNYEQRLLALSEMSNLRWGKVAELLEPVYNGEMAVTDDTVKARAIFASSWMNLATKKAISQYLPVYLDAHNGHEVRITALRMIFFSEPDVTTLSTIVTSLYREPDYEVANFAFTLFEQYANSINPCTNHQAHQSLAKYFLKYMKQAGFHEINYGFGLSKTYLREFQKEKYGYGGAYNFYTVGSHHSTTPLAVGMAITSNQYHGKQTTLLGVHLRIEGLAKALVRKFKKLPEAQWKISNLASLLQGMGVRAKPDQPVRVEVVISVKGSVVIHRVYSENDVQPGGKIANFLKKISDAAQGGKYSINHQRALLFGESIYEQPTDSGLPMAHFTLLSTMASIQADVKADTTRGVIGREVNYDLNLNTDGLSMMFFHNQNLDTHAVYQHRVYGFHSKRKVKVSAKLIGTPRELQLHVSRPSYSDPLTAIMHSKTVTAITNSHDLTADTGLSGSCSGCPQFYTVTKGSAFMKDRAFVDMTNENAGAYMYGGYFRCEMDISRKNTVGHALGAFMPYNKNPKTPWTMFTMGMRQIRAFFLYFPRAEQCGAFFRWSQSQTNPVTGIGIKLTAKAQTKPNSKLFLRGRRVLVKMDVLAKGTETSKNRVYKINAEYDTDPGSLQNKVTFKLSRKANPAIGMSAYMMCMKYQSKYPDFGDEFLTVDMSQDLQVTGFATMNFGPTGASCATLPSGIKVDFLHSSTPQSRADVRNTWYGKMCEVDKAKQEWSERVGNGLYPMTEVCSMTNYDAAKARKYTWMVQFKGLPERVKTVLSKAQTVMKAGFMPYWDVDPEALSAPIADSPKMQMSLEFKSNEELVDIKMKTSHGTTDWLDIPVRLPGWTDRLRNLKFSKTVPRLIQADILTPCIQTTQTVQTIDNTTLAYQPQSCYSLISAHCSEKPVYAVFTKASGSGLDMKAYLGGHQIKIIKAGVVTVDGSEWNVVDHEEKVLMEGDQEIFKLLKWGSTFNIYSYLKVWIMFDGTFVEVVPAPSVKGQHCGVCGNYDNNRKNELFGKNGQIISEANLASEWCE